MVDVAREVKKLMAGALAPHQRSLAKVEKSPQETDKENAMDSLVNMEDRLYDQAISVVRDAMAFGDLDPEVTEVPQSWIDDMGLAKAERKFRNTKAGQMKSSEAPSGVKLAEKIATGIMKTKAARGAAPVLNLSLVQLTVEAAPREYPTQSRES